MKLNDFAKRVTKTAQRKKMRTDHETDMQVLWFQSYTQTMAGIWKDMCNMQKNQPTSKGQQKWQKQKVPQH